MRELYATDAKPPNQNVYSPSAAALPALVFNRETQSWAFSIWSLCGRNWCGLEDRAVDWEPGTPDQSLQLVIYWIFLPFIDYF